MTSQPPHRLALLGLIALLPEVAYLLTQEEGLVPILALVCIGLIVGSLYLMLSPDDLPTPAPQ